MLLKTSLSEACWGSNGGARGEFLELAASCWPDTHRPAPVCRSPHTFRELRRVQARAHGHMPARQTSAEEARGKREPACGLGQSPCRILS